LLPSTEAFECHQNLTIVHQTAALHIDEGQGNQSRLIDDMSRGGRDDLTPPFWVTICVANFSAIWCRYLLCGVMEPDVDRHYFKAPVRDSAK
jgi:hypothetical protein